MTCRMCRTRSCFAGTLHGPSGCACCCDVEGIAEEVVASGIGTEDEPEEEELDSEPVGAVCVVVVVVVGGGGGGGEVDKPSFGDVDVVIVLCLISFRVFLEFNLA